jgi:hypothetical protein
MSYLCIPHDMLLNLHSPTAGSSLRFKGANQAPGIHVHPISMLNMWAKVSRFSAYKSSSWVYESSAITNNKWTACCVADHVFTKDIFKRVPYPATEQPCWQYVVNIVVIWYIPALSMPRSLSHEYYSLTVICCAVAKAIHTRIVLKVKCIPFRWIKNFGG